MTQLKQVLKMAKISINRMFNTPEDEIDFDSFVKFSSLFFNFLFFDFKPLSHNADWRETTRHVLKILYLWFNVICMIAAQVMMLAYSILLAPEIVKALANIPIVVSITITILRTLSSVLHKEDFRKIFEELRGIFANRRSQNVTYKVKRNLDAYHRIVKFYSGLFLISFLPIVLQLFPFLIDGTMKLTTNYWYPFDPFQPRNFIFALLWVDYISYLGLVYTVAADSLLYALISVVGMEFDILKRDLATMKFCPIQDRDKRIKSLAERHNKLFQVGETLQSIYGPTFLFYFLITSFVICFVAFQLLTASDIAMQSFYVLYLSMSSIQIFILCYFGQKIIDSSEGVADGIYNCGWEEIKEESFKKRLILMMMKSQTPMKLSALNFIDVSIPSFSAVSSISISIWID